MEKIYEPHSIETKWYETWEQNNYFAPRHEGKPYCIMLPPPNITGSLHMGHGFQHTLMDALIRYHRMRGENVLWQAGTDHASIATQMVVERRLLAQGTSRHDLGREKFLEKVWEWKQESGGNITRQLRRMGASMDWSREAFTMDENYSQAVRDVFIRLHAEGYIYRGQKLVNWDPQLLTAISDLEVTSEETKGELWYIRYPLAEGNDSLVVATTRPETMLGDVAVAVHPDDERYQKLIGKHIKLPLTDRLIPIIADLEVDPAFGTGCVKITPAHDFNDNAMAQRHQLPMINIFTPNAHINDNAPEKYQGLERFAARKKILSDLTELNLLEKTEPHTLKIPRGDRSGVVIEPYLTYQWFMKMDELAKPAIKAVKDGSLKFIPEGWNKTYFQWLENIEDWCISRQLWWGHRIPAWYDEQNNVYIGVSEAEVREKYQLDAAIHLQQDNDVLDTWFSAGLWPFVTLGWPEQTPEYKAFYPTNVLVTGFDIIFFWVARMVMLGLKFTEQLPFTEIYITGLIRDHEGQKMSKTKGNVLDPIDLIDGIDLESLVEKRTSGLMQPQMAEKINKATRKHFPDGIPAFGTDALRFTFCALASANREIRFDLQRVEGNRNFCNKLWNATRFVLMNVEGKFDPQAKDCEFTIVDQWILARLQQTIQALQQYFAEYRFDLLAQSIYEFVWNEYCDWYLELTKPILNDESISIKIKNGTAHTLLTVLETALRLLHPVMPFITEEIWQRIKSLLNIHDTTIMLQSYPEYNANKLNQTALDEVEWLKQVILNIRSIRSEMNISPAKSIPLLLHKGTALDHARMDKYKSYITSLAKIETYTWLQENDTIPQASIALVGDLQLLIPLAGLIDMDAEIKRLQKEVAKHQQDFDKINNKLTNPSFIQNAPQDVVTKDKARVAELIAAIEKLNAQLERLS